MSPEEENGKLLRGIARRVDQTHESLVRVEERLGTLSDRVTSLDKNIEIIRTAQQHQGTEVAIVQQECSRRGKMLSRMSRKIEVLDKGVGAVEHTGKMLVLKQSQTWKTVAIVGTIFIGIAGMAIGILKVIF